MPFNSHATNQDLYSDARTWCGIAVTDTTTYPLTEFTRDANSALDDAIAIAFRADARWQYDDKNYTNLPRGYTAVTSGQSDYGMSVAHLKVTRVRIQDPQGNWITLKPIDRRDLTDSQLAETGTPRSYDALGNSIFVFPTPNYSVANDGSQYTGLEFEHQRGASHFVTTDTTKSPGFPSQYDRYCSIKPARDYCDRNDMDKRSKKLSERVLAMEASMTEFFSSRDTDMKPSLRPKSEDYGAAALL